jgi:hypothetical protein
MAANLLRYSKQNMHKHNYEYNSATLRLSCPSHNQTNTETIIAAHHSIILHLGVNNNRQTTITLAKIDETGKSSVHAHLDIIILHCAKFHLNPSECRSCVDKSMTSGKTNRRTGQTDGQKGVKQCLPMYRET